MNDDKLTEVIIRIESKLSSIDTKVDGIVDQLKDHSHRIQRLESRNGTNQNQDAESFKNKMLVFLAKALIGSIAVIGSLCGAGGILKSIFVQ
jgi:hypothetical protein